jgi:hypothetical protein
MSEDMILLVCCILSFVLGVLVCDKIHNILASRKKEGGKGKVKVE